jgi:hypothetical protein
MDVAGGFMTPDDDQLPASGHDYYIPQHGVLLSDRQKTIFWTPIDSPVVEFGGIQTNRYLPVLVGDVNELQNSWIYSYLMHNYWHTNNPIAQGGDFVFRYSLTSQGPDWPAEKAKQFGWGVMSGMTALDGTGGGSKSAGVQGSFAGMAPDNAAITAIKRADDGQGVILRVAEIAGLETRAVVSLSLPGRKIGEAVFCDGRETGIGPASVENGGIRIDLAPFQVRAVRVLFKR